MSTFSVGLLRDGRRADRYLLELLEWGRGQDNLTMTNLLPGTDDDGWRLLDFDLLVDLRAQGVSADFVGDARLGVLSLDCSTGFWETFHRRPKTWFAIVHHTPAYPQGRAVLEGALATKYLFHLNRTHVRRKSLSHLRTLLQRLASGGELPGRERRLFDCGVPSLRHRAISLAKMAYRLGLRAGYRLLNIRQKWELSLCHGGWRHVDLARSIKLSAPRGHFWADPFLYEHEGKTYCFVEDFVFRTRRAHIAALELTAAGAIEIGCCIREDFHLSFPFLFTYGGVLYMCPESSATRQVRLYRCTTFPLQWELCHVAMDDVSAADSMFFAHGGKWWLMTSIDNSGAGDHCSELYLFSGASPFETNWVAHPQNPVRIDPEGGRNAGLVIEGDRLFRGAQRQGFDQYGEGLLLYEIVAINEQTYSERLVSEIDCSARGGLLGAHHISSTGSITVIDHLRRRFFP